MPLSLTYVYISKSLLFYASDFIFDMICVAQAGLEFALILEH